MSSATGFSKKDSAVLGAIFDPEASLAGQPHISSTVQDVYGSQKANEIRRWESQILGSINASDPKKAEVKATLAELSKLIQQYPLHASAYNNRAQARRLLFDLEDVQNHTEDLNCIITDIGSAIELASPKSDSDSVSPEQAQVLASAHTHRAYLLYKASRAGSSQSLLVFVPGMAKLDRETLEEMASRDFAAGGRYGNKVAKQMAVMTNPYAKLCGNIIKQALRQEAEGALAEST